MTAAQELYAAAEALRAANHATIDPSALDHSDLYAAVGAASQVLGRLPQLLEQLAANAAHLGRMGLDVDEMADQPAGVLAARAAEHLREAALAMAGVTVSPTALIDAAHSHLSHLKTS